MEISKLIVHSLRKMKRSLFFKKKLIFEKLLGSNFHFKVKSDFFFQQIGFFKKKILNKHY